MNIEYSDTRIKGVDRCIYCGSTENLTREHIVPKGLGGPWILQNGSCQKCAKITSAIERDVLKIHLEQARTTLGLPSYHKKNRPQSFNFELLRDGKSDILNFPVEQCPTLIMMPHFRMPAYIGKYDLQGKITAVGFSLHGSKDITEKVKNFGADGFSAKQEMIPVSFARMLAKIGYGMAILQFGISAFKEVFVISCILNKEEAVGKWVGCTEEPPIVPDMDEALHKIEIISCKGEVIARIRLFANYRTPEYLVIVGNLK